MRQEKTGECTHTCDFGCLDKDIIEELNSIKAQIQFDFINLRFTDNLHLNNDVIILYGFFLKVYVIQKSFDLLIWEISKNYKDSVSSRPAYPISLTAC